MCHSDTCSSPGEDSVTGVEQNLSRSDRITTGTFHKHSSSAHTRFQAVLRNESVSSTSKTNKRDSTSKAWFSFLHCPEESAADAKDIRTARKHWCAELSQGPFYSREQGCSVCGSKIRQLKFVLPKDNPLGGKVHCCMLWMTLTSGKNRKWKKAPKQKLIGISCSWRRNPKLM